MNLVFICLKPLAYPRVLVCYYLPKKSVVLFLSIQAQERK
jgi:hypothetical protein